MRKIFLIFLMIGLLSACITETETFIEDFHDLGLPKYTETGNNVIGAYQNEEIWKSEYRLFPNDDSRDAIKFYQNNDSIWLAFSGENKVSTKPYLLMFLLDIRDSIDMDYLGNLEGQDFSLDESNFMILSGEIGSSVFTDTLGTVLTGNLFIRNVEDNESAQDIISGTFGFDAEINPDTVSFYNGRFDFEIRNYLINIYDNTKIGRNELDHPVLTR